MSLALFMDVLSNIISNLQGIALILLIIGILLIVLEIFVPGFGVPGAAGAILMVVSVFLTAETLFEALIMFTILLSIFALVLGIIINMAGKGKLPKGVILMKKKQEDESINTKDMEYFIGKRGLTLTQLRPSGSIDLEGVKLDVVTSGDFISKGVEVEIVSVDGIRIVVKEVK